jgi:hypothetical protein
LHRSGESRHRPPAAEQARRDVDQQFVDEARAEPRAVQRRPGLDMAFVDAAAGQRV